MVKVSPSLMLLAMAVAVAAGLMLWRMGLLPEVQPDAAVAFAPFSPPLAGPASPEQALSHPIETLWTTRLRAKDLGDALVELLGQESVSSYLQVDEFPRRLVATVDNLGRSHSPAALWPVHPVPERFTVDQANGRPVIGADNALRYMPLVLLAQSVDAARAVDLYVRMYPLLQQAYEELGFPGGYFNDRLLAVIDMLLATPDVAHPVPLQLTEVKGPIESRRPWVRYEFADPQLESLTAGQKIMLRVGPENQRRLKSTLEEFRRELIKRSPVR